MISILIKRQIFIVRILSPLISILKKSGYQPYKAEEGGGNKFRYYYTYKYADGK